MELFIQAAAAAVLAVIIILTLNKQAKDISVVLAVTVCCMILCIALVYLQPVLDFLTQLQVLGSLSSGMVKILMKVTGIGILMEICAMVCADAGSASMGKALQMLGSAVILWLSLPIFTALLDLVQAILEGV